MDEERPIRNLVRVVDDDPTLEDPSDEEPHITISIEPIAQPVPMMDVQITHYSDWSEQVQQTANRVKLTVRFGEATWTEIVFTINQAIRELAHFPNLRYLTVKSGAPSQEVLRNFSKAMVATRAELSLTMKREIYLSMDKVFFMPSSLGLPTMEDLIATSTHAEEGAWWSAPDVVPSTDSNEDEKGDRAATDNLEGEKDAEMNDGEDYKKADEQQE